jgi:signal transduction histidine kinase
MPLVEFQTLLSPVAVSTVVLAVQGIRAGRRRSALNEAVHEIRRPLQAIAMAASGPRAPGPSVLRGSVYLAADALERLDREINGEPASGSRQVTRVEPLVRSAVRRWQSRAALAGASLEMRWHAGGVVLDGDGPALSQALDNLIVNAIEHGGPSVAVRGRLDGERLHLTVTDAGRSGDGARRGSPAETIARLSGKRRHGHGLAVVRRVAAAHGGRFALRRAASGSVAALELPVMVEGVP